MHRNYPTRFFVIGTFILVFLLVSEVRSENTLIAFKNPEHEPTRMQRVKNISHTFLPAQEKGPYFYVLGPDTGSMYGQPRPIQIIFFRFRAEMKEDIRIRVFDPDTSGSHDELSGTSKVSTVFSVYGGQDVYTDPNARVVYPKVKQKGTLLALKSFTNGYENEWYELGPFKTSDGDIVDGWSYFKLVVQATKGKGVNRFQVEALPQNSGEAFCFNASLSVIPNPKPVIGFFLEAPKNVHKIIGISSAVSTKHSGSYLKSTQRSLRFTQPSNSQWTRFDLDVLSKEKDERSAYHFINSSNRPSYTIFTFTNAEGYPLKLFGNKQPLKRKGTSVAVAIKSATTDYRSERIEKTFTRELPKKIEKNSATFPQRKPERDTVPAAIATKKNKASLPPVKHPSTVSSVTQKKQMNDPCLAYVFDASRSFDPDNDSLTFQWIFGDGTPGSNQMKVTHFYKKPGRYLVTLRISDNTQSNNATSETSQEIIINGPPKALAETPKYLATGSGGIFDAGSSSYRKDDTLSFEWDFGDGTKGSGRRSEHVYSNAGVYTVKLTVNDNKNTHCSTAAVERTVHVNTSPVAKAESEVSTNQIDPAAPIEVTLDGSQSYDPDNDHLTYFWDFGDGKIIEGARVIRRFSRGGRYTARLTVKDPSGTPNDTSTDTVSFLLNRAPRVVAHTPSTGRLKEEMVFDASRSNDSDGDELHYLWDFGDGKTAKDSVVKHRYQQAGVYTVRLTIDDGRGTDRSRQSIVRKLNVLAAPLMASIKPVRPGITNQSFFFEAQIPEDTEHDLNGLTYFWDLGDGYTEVGKLVRHAYRKGGQYNVKLTIKRSGQNEPIAVSETSVGVNTPPSPSFKYSEQASLNHPTHFDSSESKDLDGDRLNYYWDFGDGQISTKANPTHIYRKGGHYVVVLTLMDDSGLPGSSKSLSASIKINNPPVPVISLTDRE